MCVNISIGTSVLLNDDKPLNLLHFQDFASDAGRCILYRIDMEFLADDRSPLQVNPIWDY